jgi:hypothetical protein
MRNGSLSRRAAAIVALALPLLLVACGGGGAERAAPPADTGTTPTAAPAPPPTTTETTITATLDEPAPTPAPTTPVQPSPTTTQPEPRVATTTPPTSRTAPPARAGDLRFERIVVLAEAGRFAGRANVRNEGVHYLNGLRLRWRVVDAGGTTLDGGVLGWPSLAPGETATVHFEGRRVYMRSWRRVVFELVG